VIATSQPRRLIRRRQQGIDFRPAEKTDQGTGLSLVRNRQHPLNGPGMHRRFQRRVAEKGPNRRQTQVPAASAVAATGLQVIQKRSDERCVQVIQIQLGWCLA